MVDRELEQIFEIRRQEVNNLAERVGIMYYYRTMFLDIYFREPLYYLHVIIMFNVLDLYALGVLSFEYSLPKKWHEYEDEAYALKECIESFEHYIYLLKCNRLLSN